MYYNYNIPRYRRNMYQNRPFNRHDDRFFTGGFAVPFLLGGITGSLLTPRRPYYYGVPYNNFYYYNNNFYPYPNYPYYY